MYKMYEMDKLRQQWLQSHPEGNQGLNGQQTWLPHGQPSLQKEQGNKQIIKNHVQIFVESQLNEINFSTDKPSAFKISKHYKRMFEEDPNSLFAR